MRFLHRHAALCKSIKQIIKQKYTSEMRCALQALLSELRLFLQDELGKLRCVVAQAVFKDKHELLLGIRLALGSLLRQSEFGAHRCLFDLLSDG
jgi:hypothetical protein